MNKWKIIKLNNKEYDLRLVGEPQKIDFSLSFMFQALAILSLKFTNGIFLFKKKFYKFIGSITDFKIIKSKKSNFYCSMNGELSKIVILKKNNKTIKMEFIPSKKNYELDNSDYELNAPTFEHITEKIDNLNYKIQYLNYPTFTAMLGNKGDIIIDIPYINQNQNFNETKLVRFKLKHYHTEFKNGSNHLNGPLFGLYLYEQDEFIKLTPLEYQILTFRCIPSPKFTDDELNKIQNNIDSDNRYLNFSGNSVAIDPDGSKDRDDAIKAVEDNNFITLWVHISDVSPYIDPIKFPYYYYHSTEKVNTDYLIGGNMPLLDRRLSDQGLSLNGKNKKACTVEITYKIKSKKNMEIYPLPIKVSIYKSKKLNIIPTTYYKFSHSFSKKKENGYQDSLINTKKIIDCLDKEVMHPKIFNQGKSEVKEFNHLKRLYIYFRNSLPESNRDSVILGYDQFKFDKKIGYPILDALPTEAWAHQLVEFTALQANIYTAHAMLALEKYKKEIILINDKYIMDSDNIINLRDTLNKDYQIHKMIFQGKKHDPKKLKNNKFGIFRNLINRNYFLSDETANFFIKIINKFSNQKLPIGKVNKITPPETLSKYLTKNPKTYKLLKKHFDLVRKNTTGNKLVLDHNKLYYTHGLYEILAALRLGLIYQANDEYDLIYDGITFKYVMRSEYKYYPVIHHDIASSLYTHFTSPMRRFVDVNVHHLLWNRNKKTIRIIKKLSMDKINNRTGFGRKVTRGFSKNYSLIKFLLSNNIKKRGKLFLPKIKIKLYPPNSKMDPIINQKIEVSQPVVIKEFKSIFQFPIYSKKITEPISASITLNNFGTMEIVPLNKNSVKIEKRLDIVKILLQLDKSKNDKSVKKFLTNQIFKLNNNKNNPFEPLNLNKCFNKKKSRKRNRSKKQYGGSNDNYYYRKYIKYKTKYLELKKYI